MQQATVPGTDVVTVSGRCAQGLLIIAQNRFELLAVEAQEARVRLLHAVLLALGATLLGLLAGMALTAAIVLAWWAYAPLSVLLVLAGLYTAVALGLYWRLTRLMDDWQPFSDSLDQLRKDRSGLVEGVA